MRVASGLALSSLLLVLACVGDSSSDAAGTLGGACFPNQTCNAGLVCVSGKCSAADAGGGSDATTPNEGGASDGGVDTQNDPNNCGTIGHVCSSMKCQGGDCVRRVFVTSGTAKGTFGGAAGADNLCKVSVAGTNIKGTFYAWVSTSSSTPQTHFTKGTAPYVLVDGTTVVANSFAELAGVSQATSLAHGIDMDETGVTQSNVNVCTATHADGTLAGPPDCSDFAASPTDMNATIGTAGMKNTTWTESTTLSCTTFAHVYCVEQ